MTDQKDNVLTVTQLTNLIKTMLEGSFPNILLKGEISNYRPNISGHLYFSLKDADSQISAVMFRGNAQSLNFEPKDGTLVQVRGKITVYGPRGNYQIVITSMTKAGTGDIMEMIEERQRRLAQEGLFDQSRKRPIPLYPKTVGIITSSTGAAIQDILRIRKQRNDKINVIIFPAIVQGSDAAPSIVRFIKTANQYKMCDVLIVGRGGGSLEDLLPFSEESLVRAVAQSEIPVISGVGHDIDWSLCDFAADYRVPTPTAAAELVFYDKQQFLEGIEFYKNNLYGTIQNKIQNLRLMLKTFQPENMETQVRNIQQKMCDRFENALDSIKDSMQKIIDDKKNRIERCIETLENCNPQTVLNRGYSMVTDENGKIIRNSSQIETGAKIFIKPQNGKITAIVENKE